VTPENAVGDRDDRARPTPENAALLEQYAARIARSAKLSGSRRVPEFARGRLPSGSSLDQDLPSWTLPDVSWYATETRSFGMRVIT
jgi:hypothetical protein